MGKRKRFQNVFLENLAWLLKRDREHLLWSLVAAQFQHHLNNGDQHWEDSLNRIAREHFGELAFRVNSDTCSVADTILYQDTEPRLESHHDRRHPHVLNLPIVAMHHESRVVLLEGNTRVNAWKSLAKNRPDPDPADHNDVGLSAIIITPKAPKGANEG